MATINSINKIDLATDLERDRNGRVTTPASRYNPNQEVKDRTAQVMSEFSRSDRNRNKAFTEFNDRSLVQRMNTDQKSFNAWQEPSSQDPDDAWKSRAVRPIVRNKIISIAAHITANLLFPKVFAQNENDDEDRDAAEVMRDMMEWWADESNYDENFLHAVISALVNPAAIIHTEYAQSYRKVKDTQLDGTWETKTVIDEIFSGFINSIVPVDEFLIENFYEHNIQKQGYVIWRKFPSYTKAQAKYNTNSNFKEYVRPGIQTIYNRDDAMFYDVYDRDMTDDSVEEVHYYNRNEDLYLIFVNGILLTDPDNPNPRADKKYPFMKTGYELIDEGRFFYFRSLANKTSVDEEVVNTLYRMIIDGTYLQLMPPVAIFGDEEVDSGVIMPGMVSGFQKDTKIERINVGNDLDNARETLEKVESSVSESSISNASSGQLSEGTPPTAFEVSRAEQNAITMLGLFGKMIGFLVKDWGDMAVNDIVQFSTVADYTQIGSPSSTLKFRNIVIPDRENGNGTKKTRKIELTNELPTSPSKQETIKESFRIMEKEETNDGSFEIVKVNPKVFRESKFKLKISPDIIAPLSDNLQKALNIEAYDRAIQNPMANQEAVFKDLLLGSFDKTKDNPDKYITNKSASPVAGQLAKAIGADQG